MTTTLTFRSLSAAAATAIVMAHFAVSAQDAVSPDNKAEVPQWMRSFGNAIASGGKVAVEAVEKGMQQAGSAGNAAVEGVNQAHQAANSQYKVAGTVDTHNGMVVTYFEGIEFAGKTAGYVNRTAVKTPGGSVPAFYIARNGTAVPNDLNEARRLGVLVVPKPVSPVGTRQAGARTDSCDPTGSAERGFSGKGTATRVAVCDVEREIADKSTPVGGLMDKLFDQKAAKYAAQEQKREAQQASSYGEVQNKADGSFADIQAQVARDAAAARAQAKKAQGQ